MLYLYLSALTSEEDKDRFEELYLKYRQMMYSVAYKILNNVNDFEDAVHQTFIRIADNFKKIKEIPCHELKPFIVIIVRNTAINIYNRNKRIAERTTDIDDADVSVEEGFFDNMDYGSLLGVIDSLPAIYREILYLRYVRDLTPKEVSRLLGISADNVRKRTERAKKLLRKALEDGENDE